MVSESFLPLYFSFSPCPIVPMMWHDGGFLDPHSTQQGTALAPAAKTPYLRLAACWQDAAVRRCRGQRLQDEMGHGLMDELSSYRKASSNIRVLKLKKITLTSEVTNGRMKWRRERWLHRVTRSDRCQSGDWSFLTTRLHLFPHSATRSMIWYRTLCLLDLVDEAVLQVFCF